MVPAAMPVRVPLVRVAVSTTIVRFVPVTVSEFVRCQVTTAVPSVAHFTSPLTTGWCAHAEGTVIASAVSTRHTVVKIRREVLLKGNHLFVDSAETTFPRASSVGA